MITINGLTNTNIWLFWSTILSSVFAALQGPVLAVFRLMDVKLTISLGDKNKSALPNYTPAAIRKNQLNIQALCWGERGSCGEEMCDVWNNTKTEKIAIYGLFTTVLICLMQENFPMRIRNADTRFLEFIPKIQEHITPNVGYAFFRI